VRSDYILDENARLYEQSVKLWEGLRKELNYNLMFSQRGMVRTGTFRCTDIYCARSFARSRRMANRSSD
jgi:hypothetical protein